MKKENHVTTIDQAMEWLNIYDYRVWEEISKKTEHTSYYFDCKKFNLQEDFKYVIIASDNVLELATNSDADVIQFVNDMIDCYNELQEEVRAYEQNF